MAAGPYTKCSSLQRRHAGPRDAARRRWLAGPAHHQHAAAGARMGLAMRAPLPLSFIVVSAVAALIGDFGIPFRHLVEGGFGFINLVLALFAGAFFGHMMRGSGAADAAAAGILRLSGARLLPLLTLAALPLF